MVTFIIIIAVILLVGNGMSKKKPAAIIQKQVPKRTESPRSKQSLPLSKPNEVCLRLATEHFGLEWQRYLVEQKSTIKITNQRVRETVAYTYQKMSAKELEKLLLSFIQINFTHNLADDNDKNRADLKNYKALHSSVYQLIRVGRFRETELLVLLKKMSADYKSQPKAPAVMVEKKAFTATKIPSIQPLLVNTPIVKPNEDTSIIEIDQTPYSLSSYLSSAQPCPAGSNEDDYDADDAIPPERYQPYVPQERVAETQYYYDPDLYKLGTKYKKKLNLSKQEISWLNKFDDYGNTFNSIEMSGITIVKLYLLTLKKIIKQFADAPYTLTSRIEDIKTAVYDHSRQQPTSWPEYDHSYVKQRVESDIYYILYKKCEAVVRDAWGHKRKISADFNSISEKAKELFRKNLEPAMDGMLASLLPTIPDPDEETEFQLNLATTTRWKGKFEALTKDYQASDHTALIASFHELGRLNQKNPSVENIYYECSKFMAAYDKLESLKFYLHYIYQDLNSIKVDNKVLNKSIQKKLFAKQDEFETFEKVVKELSVDRDIEKALADVEHVYKAKRRTILLDRERIKKVEEQHSGTVNILNEYLQDEEDETTITPPPISSTAIDNDETISITIGNQLTVNMENTVSLAPEQLDLLSLFKTSDFTLSFEEVERFARERSQFKNQLIDGINDRCYEFLDDILIEEENDNYTISTEYYNRIILQ